MNTTRSRRSRSRPILRTIRHIWVPLLPLILAIPAIQPLLRNELTAGYDNVLHLWRAFEADLMLSHGIFYTRWYPHMVFGLGYPMLLFNPPLSPLLAALLHRLGLDWPAAVNGVFALGTLLSGWTVWLLVRDDRCSVETQNFASLPDAAALVATAAMVTIPFHAYVNFHRASMSEALAWAFPGLILWGLRRWQHWGERLGLLAATLGLALMLLTHDAFTYLFMPMLGLLVIASALGYRSWRGLGRGILAIGLGLGLAAFFWIPSILERGYVQFDRVLHYNYAASFVPLDYLLEPPRTADTSLINPWPPKGIGLLPVLVIGLVVLVGLWKFFHLVRSRFSSVDAHDGDLAIPLEHYREHLEHHREHLEHHREHLKHHREHLEQDKEHYAWCFWWGAMTIATVGYLWMTSPSAAWFWKLVPPLAYLHFPWRFLAPATVGIAAMVGLSVGWLARSDPRWRYAPYGIITLLILGSLGWLYPRSAPLSHPVSLAGMMAYENETHWLGGTTFGELLPRWVEALPSENPVAADLSAGRPPARLRPEDLPEGAKILRATYGPHRADIDLTSPVVFRARYWTFYYPGWRVYIDGQPVEITPGGHNDDTANPGLITFEVPSGHHTIAVRFGETPLRWAADAVSLISLIVLGIVLLRYQSCDVASSRKLLFASGKVENSALWLLIGLVILLLILKVLIIDRINNPLRYDNLVIASPQKAHLRNVDVSRQVIFDGQFHLLGHRALPDRYTPGGSSDRGLDVYLYWWDAVPGGADYRVGLALKDAHGLRWNDPAQYPPRWTREPPPTSQWPMDRYAQTAFTLRPLPGTPPGVYTVTVSVFDARTSATYPAMGVETQNLASLPTEIVLGRVYITRPQSMPEKLEAYYHVPETPSLDKIETSSLDEVSDRHPCRALDLTGYNVDREEAAPGDPLLVTLFWKLESAVDESCVAYLQLLDAHGEQVMACDLPPVREDFPVSTWQAGDVWRGQHLLWLPPGLESGRYDWRLRLCPETSSEVCISADGVMHAPTFSLKPLDIHAPERHWTVPALDIETDVHVGDVAILLGVILEPGPSVRPGDVLHTTLVWRADSETRTSYRVFLHLIGPENTDGWPLSAIAQSDGVPGAWTRPTTGWISGEILKDPRALPIPPETLPGTYRLQAGMYTLEGGRLPTSEGDDAVILGEIIVVDKPAP